MIAFLKRLFLYDLLLKLFSLALAILIWLTISFAIRKESPSIAPFVARPVQQASFVLPVMVLSSATDPRNLRIEPKQVEVTLEGDARIIRVLDQKELRAVVDLSGIEAARDLVKRIEISKPAGLTEVRVLPQEVKVIILPKS
jgi:YbbR domain-containing protein